MIHRQPATQRTAHESMRVVWGPLLALLIGGQSELTIAGEFDRSFVPSATADPAPCARHSAGEGVRKGSSDCRRISGYIAAGARFGSDDEVAHEKQILANLIWSPFNPSSDRQLIPIRKLEANKALAKVKADDKLSDAEKNAEIAKLKEELAKIDAMETAAESDPYQKRVAAFIAADKAGDKATVKKMIADFAAGFASTN